MAINKVKQDKTSSTTINNSKDTTQSHGHCACQQAVRMQVTTVICHKKLYQSHRVCWIYNIPSVNSLHPSVFTDDSTFQNYAV